MEILGIDIGGSGVKGALVNTDTAEVLTERRRISTPQPSTPPAVAKTVQRICQHFNWQGAIGCGFPSAVQRGIVKTAANVHKDWIGTDAVSLFSEATGCQVVVLNDADAAGLAEVRFGAGKGRQGVILVVTIGTGLGTALFVDGRLVPNLEMGHIEIRGKDAETRASDAARKRKNMSRKEWAGYFNEYLCRLNALLYPDLIILGGGASKKFDKFKKYLTLETEIVPAEFLNEAGIVGAALAAELKFGQAQPETVGNPGIV
jgi:polyphosphate glucokinase